MKNFLLIAGFNYYPSGGEGDWVACFESHEEALAQVEKIDLGYYIKNHGGRDWYEIVDLSEWT